MTKRVFGQAWTKYLFFWKNEIGWDDSYVFYKLNLFYISSKVFDEVFFQRFNYGSFIMVVFCGWYASFEQGKKQSKSLIFWYLVEKKCKFSF